MGVILIVSISIPIFDSTSYVLSPYLINFKVTLQSQFKGFRILAIFGLLCVFKARIYSIVERKYRFLKVQVILKMSLLRIFIAVQYKERVFTYRLQYPWIFKRKKFLRTLYLSLALFVALSQYHFTTLPPSGSIRVGKQYQQP